MHFSGATNYWAIMPASGKGSRFHQTRAKQYFPLADGLVIEKSLQVITGLPWLQLCIVALNGEDDIWPTLACASLAKVRTCVGGAERSDSVFNALLSLQKFAKPEDWVLVHDAARPCVKPADIERLRVRLVDHPIGGILACPVVDTLKKAGESEQPALEGDDNPKRIHSTVDRSDLWRALTPQMFRFGPLFEALAYCRHRAINVTDEASALEACQHEVLMVQGASSNIKITYPEDLPLAEFLLSREAYS